MITPPHCVTAFQLYGMPVAMCSRQRDEKYCETWCLGRPEGADPQKPLSRETSDVFTQNYAHKCSGIKLAGKYLPRRMKDSS